MFTYLEFLSEGFKLPEKGEIEVTKKESNKRKRTKYGLNFGKEDEWFINDLLDGKKTIDARTKRSYSAILNSGIKVGTRVAIVVQCHVVGGATVDGFKVYQDKEDFDKDYDKHLLKDGPHYYDEEKGKVGIILKDVVRLETPVNCHTLMNNIPPFPQPLKIFDKTIKC